MPARLLDDMDALRARRSARWLDLPEGALPAGVAELDVEVPPFVAAALHAAVERGDVGYPPSDHLTGIPESFAAWARRRWDLAVSPGGVTIVADIVRGIECCLHAFTRPGDGVLVQTPIYDPFPQVCEATGRRFVAAPLGPLGEIDFDALDRTIARERPRVLLLCNPHNPTGRVFPATEVAGLAALAARHDLVVVSDEVHADLAYEQAGHVPIGVYAPERTVTLQSPSKAFNLAGLRLAVAATAAPSLHARLAALPVVRVHGASILGLAAALAAWTDDGEAWLASLVVLLSRNVDRLTERLAPTPLCLLRPDASYLAWIDCRALGPDPSGRLLAAGVDARDGERYGPTGKGYVRLNIGAGPRVLDAVLDRVVAACECPA